MSNRNFDIAAFCASAHIADMQLIVPASTKTKAKTTTKTV